MKDKDLEKALLAINKKYGDRAVVVLGDEEAAKITIPMYSTGSYALDFACGGGLPLGRVIEIFGPQASGKSTIAQLFCAHVQQAFPEDAIGYIDTEHSFNVPLAISYGLDFDRVIINQPNTGEEAFDIAEALAKTGKVRVIVIDSVAALEPAAEAEADMAQQSVGLQARMVSKAMRKLTSVLHENNCALVFVNQLREKVGVLYGNPETTPGGRALAFYSSIRLRVSAGEPKKQGDEQIGHTVKVKVAKNKCAMPFKNAEFTLLYGIGVDPVEELVGIAVTTGIITQKGAWFYYTTNAGDELKFQGRDAVAQVLKEDGAIFAEIERKIRGEAA